MKLLITPAEVVALAFASDGRVRPSQIAETEIAAAQEKYFVPVFGSLFESMLQGNYAQLADEWIKPALAEFVKSRAVMTMGAITASGVVTHTLDTAESAPVVNRVLVARQAFDRAKTLRAKAVAVVEADAANYPEYDPRKNILNRTRCDGGIIL